MQAKVLVLLVFLGIVSVCSAGYNLKDNWHGGDIFNNFFYFTNDDPTHGYVNYANKDQANQWGFTYTQNGKAYIKSDSTSVSSGRGRGSVRLQSNKVYTHGLFIFDFEHMPTGPGTWPAVWTTEGTHWPAGGEIDIVEGVNWNTNNQMTLHTSPGCYVPTNKNAESGNPGSGDCQGNNGCGISDPDSNSYGPGFNNIGGGVYAMQWESSGVYVWFFPRNAIPQDIKNNAPNFQGWGNPRARFTFGQGCNGDQFFYNHGIIIDNTFCGDWAGNVYPGGNGACIDHVKNNPQDYKEAYWVFNYIQVYQQ